MAEAKQNRAIVILIVIILIGGGVGVAYFLNRENDETDTSTPSTQTTDQATPPTSIVDDTDNESEYADGSYIATGNYRTPGGTENISVTVTLENGVITSTSAEGSATSGNSSNFQDEFLSGYQSEVVGRQIDDVRLNRIAGSSLTSAGFNEAIDSIKNDARS